MSGIPIPRVLDRSERFATLQFINEEDILGYRIRVANSLDNAYGPANGVGGVGTTALFDMLRGRATIAKEIRQKGLGVSGDITRGQTRHTFDPNSYFGDSPEVPPDSDLWFLRVQVSTVTSAAIAGSVPAGFPGGVFPGTADQTNQSRIVIMRNPNYQLVPRPALTLYGTAPDLATAQPGLPAPPEAMEISVPAFADGMTVINHDGADPLLWAPGENLPLMRLDPGARISVTTGMGDTLVVCASGANPTFSIFTSTVTGLR